MKKILLTRKMYFDHIKEIDVKDYEVLTSFDYLPSKEELREVEIVLGNIDTDLLKDMPNLKFLQISNAGSEKYAFRDEIKNKVILANSTGCYSDSISEWAIGMIMYFYKNLNVIIPNQSKHIYFNPGETKTVYGSKVLIIGCGSIGMYTARKLNALGALVDGIKKTVGEKPDYLDNLYTNDKLSEVISDYDIIFMSLPANDTTYHYMNKELLNKLKDGSLLMNVGRGSCIDEEALIEVLKNKKIYACLDVFEKEPLDEKSELWDLENVLITPHSTGNETCERTRQLLTKLALENLDNYLNNRPLKNVVDFNTGYKISNT
ncbi:MAG: D-2-hydroxyacid dehydrogenase [Erysipelotrichaceae bacterium]|nr:D-2-hydroxyacid dehydrogenase [Erysipelotrichaceae bacterium]